MTPREWDHHEKILCERCEYDKRGRGACPAKATMHKNPKDEHVSVFFKKGRCSQFEEKKKKPRRRR